MNYRYINFLTLEVTAEVPSCEQDIGQIIAMSINKPGTFSRCALFPYVRFRKKLYSFLNIMMYFARSHRVRRGFFQVLFKHIKVQQPASVLNLIVHLDLLICLGRIIFISSVTVVLSI